MSKKISQLTEAVAVIGTDILPVVESNTTKKVQVETMLATKMLNKSIWATERAASTVAKVPADRAPSFEKLTDDGASSYGIYTYVFSSDRDEEIHYNIRIPSHYKWGTNIYPTFHFVPSDINTGNVKIAIEYVLLDGNSIPNSVLLNKTFALDGVIECKELDFDVIDGSGISGSINNQFLVRLKRDVSVASNYTGNIFIIEFTLTFERDQIGNSTRTEK